MDFVVHGEVISYLPFPHVIGVEIDWKSNQIKLGILHCYSLQNKIDCNERGIGGLGFME